MRLLVASVVCLMSFMASVATGGPEAGPLLDRPTIYDYASEPCASDVITRYINGDIVERLGLATWFRSRSCRNAIPYLVTELQHQYDGMRCEPLAANLRDYERFCVWTKGGNDAGTVDLNHPILAALGTLCQAPWYRHGARWFEVLDECVEVENPAMFPVPGRSVPHSKLSGSDLNCPQLVDRLRSVDPIDKMGAAFLLVQGYCTSAVPALLEELPSMKDPPTAASMRGMDCVGTATRRVYVSVQGKDVPYIDYHGPILNAASVLSVRYFEPDHAWYAAVERWIREHFPNEELRPNSRMQAPAGKLAVSLSRIECEPAAPDAER